MIKKLAFVILFISSAIFSVAQTADGSSWINTDYNTTEGTEFYVTFMYNYGKQVDDEDGVYSVLGNHDFLIYRHDLSTDEERTNEVDRLAQYEQDSLGWHVLRNAHSRINEWLTLVGVDNKSGGGQGFHTIQAGDLSKAMEGTGGFRILLTHDPSHWRAEVADQQPIALTLSGHTHAGQVKLFGWPLSATMFRDNIGWINATQQALYINQGIGCTLPFRLNCPQEITIITLKTRNE